MTAQGSVPVGLDPVAVPARTDTEVWAVNLLSDSVSVVDVGATPPRVIYLNGTSMDLTDVIFNCVTCHALNPSMGFFGTAGQDTIEGETQFFKVTQLRTVYDKIGMFGHTFADNGDARTFGGPRVNVGPQIRASGTLHDGSAAGPEEFLTASVFQLSATDLKQVVDFTFAFTSNLAPVVGQQVTLRQGSGADVNARIDLLKQRAPASFVLPGNITMTECNLTARAVVNGQPRGFLFQPGTNNFLDSTGATVTEAQVRANVPVTFTCVYPGGGRRLSIDRNGDNALDNGNGQPMQPPMMQPPRPSSAWGGRGDLASTTPPARRSLDAAAQAFRLVGRSAAARTEAQAGPVNAPTLLTSPSVPLARRIWGRPNNPDSPRLRA